MLTIKNLLVLSWGRDREGSLRLKARFFSLPGMQTVVRIPEGETPCTIREVVAALKGRRLAARHEKKDWGDWIHLGVVSRTGSAQSIFGGG